MASKGPKRKQVTYTPAKKLEVLDKLEKKEMSRKEIMKAYDLPSSTLSTWIKNKESIERTVTKTSGSRVRYRPTNLEPLEDALYEFIVYARNVGMPLNGPAICTKAASLAEEMGLDNWTPNNGWLHRFREKRGLRTKVISGESASVDLDVVHDWRKTALQEVLKEFSPRDVFNADETGLFYRCLPNRTTALKGETCKGGKQSKERITVLLCANMDGSEKIPCLVVGKFGKPRCFKGTKQLPVQYEFNRKSWMTTTLFETWLRKLYRKFEFEGRRVCLFLENCPAHPKMELSHIRLEFMPPNTTSVLQPCDQGIIQNFKCWYRNLVMQRYLVELERQDPVKNIKELFNYTLLDALQYVRRAWEMVTQETVANCFRHAGFKTIPQEDPQEAQEDLQEEPEVTAMEEGGASDSEDEGMAMVPLEGLKDVQNTLRDLKARGADIDPSLTVQDIVDVDANVCTTREMDVLEFLPADGPSEEPSAGPSQDSDSEDEADKHVTPPTASEMRAAMDTVLRFMMSKEATTDKQLAHGFELAKITESLARSGAKQSTLDQFFKKV